VKFVSCTAKGDVKRVNLLSYDVHPFVRLGLDTGAAVSVCIDNSTSSSSLLK
jgi:hypothetical protein